MATKKVVGVVRGLSSQTTGVRAGIGYDSRESKPQSAKLTDMVHEELQEEMLARAVSQSIQGSWTKWRDVISCEI